MFSLKEDNTLTATIEYEGNPHSLTVTFADIVTFYDPSGKPQVQFPFVQYWLNKFTMKLYVSTVVIDGATYNILNSMKVKTFTFNGTK